MDPEHIEVVAPVAGSPDLRSIIGEPTPWADIPGAARRRADVSFEAALDEAVYGERE